MLKGFDLNGVCADESSLYNLSDNFEIIVLKIVETKTRIDRVLKIHGLSEFCIENDDNFLATCLYEIAFINKYKNA